MGRHAAPEPLRIKVKLKTKWSKVISAYAREVGGYISGVWTGNGRPRFSADGELIWRYGSINNKPFEDASVLDIIKAYGWNPDGHDITTVYANMDKHEFDDGDSLKVFTIEVFNEQDGG